MFYSILVRFKISRKLAQLVRSSRYTLLVGPDLLAVCPSGLCWCLSTSTGGRHCRGGGLMVCHLVLVQLEPLLVPLLPGSKAVSPGLTSFTPLQLKESMVVILQWSSGHSVVGCSGSCLGLGLKTGLFHYYISGSRIVLNAIHWENFWRMRRWFIMQRCFR